MATTTTAQRIDHNAVKVSVTSDLSGDPVLYWYVDGRLVSASAFPRDRVISLYPGQTAVIEVLDTTDAPVDAFGGEVLLQWSAVAGAITYKVQQWVVDEWVDKRVVVTAGEELFTHLTEVLDDDTEYQFRVLPINGENIEGTALGFTFTVVRRPDAPDTTAVYDDGTGQVTVDAA